MNFTPLVPISLLGFLPVGIFLFALLPARRAVAACFILGWLFLPPGARYSLPGIPDFTKYHAIAYAAMLGALIFDLKTLLKFRPGWFDIPAVIFMFVPLVSSITNDLGVRDGLSSVFVQATIFTIAYFLGRVYFADLAGIRELALWILAGGIIYIPLCLIEIRLSPQLNMWVYGYHQHAFGQTRRWGGWRPMVFMNHGLMLGLWMCAATLIATIMWMSGSIKRFMMLPIWAWACALAGISVLCKSFGALALLAMALTVGYLARQMRVPLFILTFAMLPIGYMTTRGLDLWDGQQLIDAATMIGGEQRGGSLFVRIRNENVLVDRALQQPLFGWGGWDRNRPSMAETGFRVITDGLWVIVLGQRGLVGLIAMVAMMTLPVILFLTRWGMAGLTHPWLAPAYALALLTIMFLTDSVFNSMPNMVYMVAIGALTGLRPTPEIMHWIRYGRAPGTVPLGQGWQGGGWSGQPGGWAQGWQGPQGGWAGPAPAAPAYVRADAQA